MEREGEGGGGEAVDDSVMCRLRVTDRRERMNEKGEGAKNQKRETNAAETNIQEFNLESARNHFSFDAPPSGCFALIHSSS